MIQNVQQTRMPTFQSSLVSLPRPYSNGHSSGFAWGLLRIGAATPSSHRCCERRPENVTGSSPRFCLDTQAATAATEKNSFLNPPQLPSQQGPSGPANPTGRRANSFRISRLTVWSGTPQVVASSFTNRDRLRSAMSLSPQTDTSTKLTQSVLRSSAKCRGGRDEQSKPLWSSQI